MKILLSASLALAALSLGSTGPIHANRAEVYLEAPFQATATNSTPLTAHNNVFYATVRIGSNAAPFRMAVDTTTPDNFVYAKDCKDAGCGGAARTRYVPGSSTTSKDGKRQFAITHNGNGASGEVFFDTVSVAGVTVEHQEILPATMASRGFKMVYGDGYLGLAPSDTTTSKNPTLLDNAVKTQSLAQHVFSIYLPRGTDFFQTGELTFGGSDPAHFTGVMSYVPRVAGSTWQVQTSTVMANGKPADAPALTTTLSTVEPLILLDDATLKGLEAHVPGAKTTVHGWTFPCSTVPSISFKIGTAEFDIPAEIISLGPVLPNSLTCRSAITNGAPPGTAVLGTLFLSEFYTVYDKTNNRIGFAKSV